MKVGSKVEIIRTNQVATIMQIDAIERVAQVYFIANYEYYIWFSFEELFFIKQ